MWPKRMCGARAPHDCIADCKKVINALCKCNVKSCSCNGSQLSLYLSQILEWHSKNMWEMSPSEYVLHYKKVVPSVLWRCWLGGRKGIRPVKNWVVRCWRGYLSGARCRFVYAQLMPLPLTVSCFSKIQIGFTFLVPAYPGCPGKEAVKWL